MKLNTNTHYPKISIVTPSYNQGKYIEETILSIINQGYPNLEYIIIDGGSTDNTVDIIKKYEKHITYWVSEPDEGQSHAINKGIEKCTGDIFNWINSDDYLEKDALYHIAKAFITNDAEIVSGKVCICKINGMTDTMNGHYYGQFSTLGFATSRLFQPSTFILRSILNKIGKLSNQLNYVMDVELYLKYFLYFGYNKVFLIDELIINYRHHENSKSVLSSYMFTKEIDLIYYHLALSINNHKIAHFIYSNLLDDRIMNMDYKLNLIDKYLSYDTIQNTLTFFLYSYFIDFYTNGLYMRAKYLIKLINYKVLDKNRREIFLKSRFNLRYFIYLLYIRRFFRNIRK